MCLPDDAAKETVALADALGEEAPRILDASTAHRVAPGWVYGFAELDAAQADKVRAAQRVANPGCYPTGAIALIRPLVDAGIIPADHPLTVNAVSGYSGGGRSMIEAYEAGTAPPFELYALGLEHKHVPELMRYAGLTRRPIFVPSVGNFRQGMLVSIPLHLDMLPGAPSLRDIEQALAAHYRGAELVSVVDGADDQGCAACRRGSQRHRQARAVRVRQTGVEAGGSRRPPRQSRQGRGRRGGAEHPPDAGHRRGGAARLR